MKKDVNFIFFGILILLMLSIVGIALYSDYSYHKINNQYQDFKEELEETKSKLNETRTALNEKERKLNQTERELVDIINELNLSKQRVDSLGEYYTDLKGEKEELETDLSNMENQKEKWRSSYLDAKEEVSMCNQSLKLCNSLKMIEENKVDTLRLSLMNTHSYLGILNEELGDMEEAVVQSDLNDTETLLEEIEAMQSHVEDLQANITVALSKVQ